MPNQHLKELQNLVAENRDQRPQQKGQQSLDSFFQKEIADSNLRTMSISYDPEKQYIKVQLIHNIAVPDIAETFCWQADSKSYLHFCKETLGINVERQYNDSVNKTYGGIPARIFAMLPPYKPFPLVVISTSKTPPDTLDALNSEDERRLKKAMEGNVLITGASGSGKTYLLNYLLKKHIPETERIGIVQEFQEIYPPNEYTDTMLIPPKTPGQPWNDLEIITEQTNLMRYDRVILGEIKGSEAWPFVINCASGTKGTATLHGSSAQKALQRLRTLCLSASGNLSSNVIDSFIKDAIDYVVYVEDHIVKEVKKLNLVNNGNFSLENVEVL